MAISYYQGNNPSWGIENPALRGSAAQTNNSNYGSGNNPLYADAMYQTNSNLQNQVSAARSCGKLSARNQLKGTVSKITEGAVNSIVEVDIGCGHKVTSVITMASLKDLGIRVGSPVTAIIKSSDVILMA